MLAIIGVTSRASCCVPMGTRCRLLGELLLRNLYLHTVGYLESQTAQWDISGRFDKELSSTLAK